MANERDARLRAGAEGLPALLRPDAPAPSAGEELVMELTSRRAPPEPLRPGVLEPVQGEDVVNELAATEPQPIRPGVLEPALGEELVNQLASAHGPSQPARPGVLAQSVGEGVGAPIAATATLPFGVGLHWREAGDGENAVLFVHGFPLSSAIWEDQLAEVPRGWRFLAPDLPGFGRTSALPAASMEIFARELDLFLEDRGIARAVVCGLSMGGYVALALHRLDPARVRALVLADTRAGADDAAARHGRYESAALARAEGSTPVTEAMLPKLLSSATIRDRPEVVERLRAIMAEATPAGVAAALEGMAERPDSMPSLADVHVPALVIVGQQDAITPREEAERMAAALGGAKVVVVPGAGHLTCMERPAEFNRALEQFLRTLV